MSKAVRSIKLFVDEEKANELRNKLLMYRFKNLGKTNDQFNNVVEHFSNGFFQNARVIELFISLLQVSPTEDVKQRLLACMKQITQSRLDEEQASIEARVFDAILKCEGSVQGGKISTLAITDTFNIDLPEKEQVTSRFMGRRIVALGFEKCRLSGGPCGYFWDAKLVERLKSRYYPPPSKVTSLTSQTSQTSLTMEKEGIEASKSSEVSEDTSSQPNSELSENTIKSEVSEESEVSEQALEAMPSVKDILKLERLTSNIQDRCAACRIVGRMDWQTTLHDGSWGMFCEKCGDRLAKKLEEVR